MSIKKQLHIFLCSILFVFTFNASAQIQFISQTSDTKNNSTITISHPTTNPSELMIAIVASNSTLFNANGWQKIIDNDLTGNSDSVFIHTYYRWGSPASISSTFLSTGNDSISVSISAYSGVDQTNPILILAQNKTPASSTFTTPTIAINTAPTIVVAAAIQPAKGKTIATLSPSVSSLYFNSRPELTIATSYHNVSSTGNYSQSLSSSGGALVPWHGQVIALRPAIIVPPTATPGAFDCLETSAKTSWTSSARAPLYTKISNTPFSFDVVALKSDGNIESNYVSESSGPKTVLVEIVDASSGSCSTHPAISSQNLTFSPNTFSIQVGRQTSAPFSINLSKSKLACRVTDSTNPANIIQSCSTDFFTLRPPNITISSSTANADSTGTNTSATPTIKAGTSFSIQANSNTIGYNGLPIIDSTKIEWINAPIYGRPQSPNPAKGAGIISGNFSSTALAATGNGATGAFSYNEAGYFRFQTEGVVDNSYATISGDSINSDCIPGSSSNTLSSGKYGCNIGLNSPSSHFGRFIPKGFVVESPYITNRSLLSCTPSSPFNYLGERFQSSLFLRPVNSENETTLNYSRNRFSDTQSSSWRLFASNPMSTRTTIHSFDNSWHTSGFLNAKINLISIKPTLPEGAHKNISIAFSPIDADFVELMPTHTNIDSNSDSTNDAFEIGKTDFYFGKMHINNHFGSDILPGAFLMNIQAYDGYGFKLQTIDSCTPLFNTNFLRTNFFLNIQDNELSWNFPSKIQNGTAMIQYGKPSAGDGLYDGALNLSYDLNAANLAFLQTNLPDGTLGYTQNPTSRINLGRKKTKLGTVFILEND